MVMVLSDFLVSFLGVNSALLLWFYSPLKFTIAEIFFKQKITNFDQFEDLIFIKFKSEKLSTLSSCFICFSFWCSFFAGLILTQLGHPWYTPFITFISYPPLCYFVKKYIFDK